MTNKRSELANILRRLADYIDRHPDQELAPIFGQAATLMQTVDRQKKNHGYSPGKSGSQDVEEIAAKLQTLRSREAGERLLQDEAPHRPALEALARSLQLPVQRDDTIERLRAKIVENTIGSRLRSEAIRG
jgi:ubiquinone biosynthesis protein UbiJ